LGLAAIFFTHPPFLLCPPPILILGGWLSLPSCRAMEKGDLEITKADLRAGTHRLLQINRLLPFLGIYAEEYSLIELNKIIVKSLPTSKKAMMISRIKQIYWS
jgi:hypothetical protein